MKRIIPIILQKKKDIVEEEYPYPYCYSACDLEAKGSEHFPVLYMHPVNGDQDKVERAKNYDENKTYFTREFGDNVDDWNSHNSPSRTSRSWGETPMLIQAQHYAHPYYPYTSLETLHRQTPQHVGGSLWHPFDHQRGYHPDAFYGGIMDAFRQPKLSYYMFASQRDPNETSALYETGPMVHIAHTMTPFSSRDVTVYSNCDEVRLTIFENGKQLIYKKEPRSKGMPNPIITFKDAFDVMQDKALASARKHDQSYLLAEGYMNGKLVAEHKVYPARRTHKIVLEADTENMPPKADGGDVITIIASVTDEKGNVKRLNNSYIHFEVVGEGELISNEAAMLNPAPVHWGTAPVLLRTTTKEGVVKIKASMLKEGEHVPLSGELMIKSVAPDCPMIFSEKEMAAQQSNESNQQQIPTSISDCEKELQQVKQELNKLKLQEVSRQQEDFGER